MSRASVLSRIQKIEVHTSITLPVVLYRCEIILTVWEVQRKQELVNKVLRRIFNDKKVVGENYIMLSFIICMLQIGLLYQGGWNIQHTWGR
jgi:hypothetical protein